MAVPSSPARAGDATPFSAENALLLAVSRLGAAPAASPLHGPGELDWDYVLEAAARQGVTALLYRWLTTGREDIAVPPAVRDALHESYWRGHFRNRLMLEEFQRIAQAAHARGIALMPLKGAELAPHYYEAPALRPLSDLDILVHPRDITPFAAALTGMGYGETAQSPSYVDDEWLDLDSRDYCYFAVRDGFDSFIEYRVAPLELAVARLTDLDRAYTDALRRHARDVWTRAGRPPGGNATWHRQSPEDLLLHVATHLAAKHLDFRLIWLRDLALILAQPGPRGLDWTYIAGQSHALRMSAPVIAALEAARAHLGAPLRDEDLDALVRTLGRPSRLSLVHRDLARLRAHVAALSQRDLRQDGPWSWPLGAALSRVRGWPARLRVLRWVLLPGEAYLEHRGTAGRGTAKGVIGSLKRIGLRLRGRPGRR